MAAECVSQTLHGPCVIQLCAMPCVPSLLDGQSSFSEREVSEGIDC